LILGNGPIIKNQQVQTVGSFRDLVADLSGKFDMKISGTPLWDPDIGSPFTLISEPELIQKLPRVNRRATVISGSVAAPYIEKILSVCGAEVPVVSVSKEIACLITTDDLQNLDLSALEHAVIIPGRAFVFDPEAQSILAGDGVDRELIRGPDMLTADAETSMGMTRDEVLALEMEGFAELIQTINRYGS
jgi:NifB/MoaA-like Fe-S oxidoreductase